ncbi:phage late control D family protein [Ancylobacter amanitiformis]|uniref:Phage protein D n=1 Tax=Ancylobacter amanitiformis TaxID=217069 RepID=A0ABU0LQK3_9HYPH|nr:hypothetical protein [Ancylobacter amanitiformis]MDQ0510868.1 phage protein D [Ancylobacter amanitiformis]
MSAFPAFKVEVNGVDYTSRFRPLVVKIDVTDRSGISTDSASIVLSDPEGSILLPQEGARLRIHLGQSVADVALVFSGFVSDVTSTGSKGGGRNLDIAAKGIDPKSNARDAQGAHVDDATFEEAAKQFADLAGIATVTIAPELASIIRPYWAMQFESFLHWGKRISAEIGATFKLQDGKAIFVPSNAGKSASGQDLPEVVATWGVNLLSWSISPVFSRPRFQKVRARYYDESKAKWLEKDVDVDQDASGTFVDRFTTGDAEQADRRAQALKSRAERNGGEGTVTIVGTPAAKAGAPIKLSGARPGIDGSYIIDSVQHTVSKPGGYTSTCEVKKPGDGVGKDTRTPNATTSPVYASSAPTNTGRAAGPV